MSNPLANNPETAQAELPRSAVLSVADQFLVSDDEGEDYTPSPIEPPNPFEDVVQYNLEYFDAHGEAITFEAGRDKEDDTRECLTRELRELDLYDHEVFGKMSSAESRQVDAEEHGGDCTIPDVIATLHTRGKIKG